MDEPIGKLLDALTWTQLAPHSDTVPVGGLMPIATHEAVLTLGDCKIRCYQLSDGRRLLDADDVNAMFDL